MEKYFRWFTARRENNLTVHQGQVEQPRITMSDVLKVLGAAGVMIWGAAALAGRLDALAVGFKDHEARIRPIEQRLATMDAKVDLILESVRGERNGRNYTSRPPR